MRKVFVVLLVCMLAPAGFGQTPSNATAQESGLKIGTTEVALDVVAKDQKGRPVTNLKASDFTILEDGVEQEIESFRLVEPKRTDREKEKTPEPDRQTGARTTPDSNWQGLTSAPEDMKAIALVFDRLEPAARALAHKAAKEYVGKNLRPGDAVGVFLIDLSLLSIQPYTTDKNRIAEAVDAAGGTATATFKSDAGEIQKLRGSAGGVPSTDVEAAGPPLGGPGSPGPPGSDPSGTIFRQMRLRSLEEFRDLDQQQQGLATTNGLLAVAQGLRMLPGRKAILFFSTGIAIPPNVERNFEAVINTANSAHVSIYTIDVAGLRVDSSRAGALSEISSMSAQRMAELGTPNEGNMRAMTQGFERIERAARSTTEYGLGRLAKETGGYLIADTNDLAGRMGEIDEDLHTYYVLTYTPKNANYDGAFRKVSVKVRKSSVSVQTREGYYAINVPDAPPVLPYEAPAVAAAVASKARTDFPLRSLATHFPEPDRPGLTPVLATVPASAVTFVENTEKKVFVTAFSIVVLVRDATRRVVAKRSKEYVLVGPLDELAKVRKTDILYYGELDLDPGRYTVDVAAYDAPSQKASVLHTTLRVAPADDALRLSSLALVEQAEEFKSAEVGEANPFRVGHTQLYPSFGRPLKKGSDKQLAFFATVYVPVGTSEAPHASLDITRAGKTVAHLTMDLPAPDSYGRIQYTNAISVESLPPGKYLLRMTVSDGAHAVTRGTQFSVAL